MPLRPRHFVLLAILIGLFVYNIVAHRRQLARERAEQQQPGRVTITGPRLDTPAWRAFDHALALRDAPPAQFDPALQDLRQQIALSTSDPATADVSGCLTWLEFYRQGSLHPGNDPQWKDRSLRHLDGCLQYHLDTTASPS